MIRKSIQLCFLIGLISFSSISGANGQKPDFLKWYSIGEAQELSELTNKDLLIFAVTEWCVYCKAMDRKAFKNSQIVTKINDHFYPVRIDIESDEAIIFNGEQMTEAQFAEQYEMNIPPKTLFLNQKGEVLFEYTGFISEEVFRQLLSAWQKKKRT